MTTQNLFQGIYILFNHVMNNDLCYEAVDIFYLCWRPHLYEIYPLVTLELHLFFSPKLRGWPSTFVKALKTLGDSVGVVGPRCRQGKTTILTHDFVSRTHMDIFDMNYYPPALTDWWLDDWMSQVYGQNRTMKSNRIEVLHHTAHQRRRYEVDKSISSRVNGLILEGQRAIKLWMSKSLSIETAVAFEKNVEQFKSFSIRDFPESVYEHLSMNESFHKMSAWTHFLH